MHSILSVRIVLHVREIDRGRLGGSSGIPTMTFPVFKTSSEAIEGNDVAEEHKDGA